MLTYIIWLLKTYLKRLTNFYFPGNTNFWIIEQLKVSLRYAVIPTTVRRGVSPAFDDFSYCIFMQRIETFFFFNEWSR